MRARALAVVAALLSVCAFASGQITPFLVEDSGGAQLYPNVSGSVVVWQEYVNGNWVIRGKDLTTKNAFTIPGTGYLAQTPVTDGCLVVWCDAGTGSFDVYYQNLQTGQKGTIAQALNNQKQPAISGDFVVWKDDRNSPINVPPEYFTSDIYGIDLRTGQEFPVCTARGIQESPDVSGHIIVWVDKGRAKTYLNPLASDIYGYDVSTGQEFLIATDPKGIRQFTPAISGDIVVWVDGHNGGDIRGYDLASATDFPIHVESPDNHYGQTQPDIDGHYVVWVDGRDGPGVGIWSIMGYDLLTGTEFTVFQGPGYNWGPKISGDLVVWYTSIAGQPSRIMAAYIPEPASVGLLGLGAALLAARRRRGSTLTPR